MSVIVEHLVINKYVFFEISFCTLKLKLGSDSAVHCTQKYISVKKDQGIISA